MELLLDTCTLLYAITNNEKLPQNIKDIIDDEKNRVFLSIASEWEIEIKHQKNSELMPFTAVDVENELVLTDVTILNIRTEYINELKNIVSQNIHKDPFDHILLAMAKEEDMTLITHDKTLEKYEGVKVISY